MRPANSLQGRAVPLCRLAAAWPGLWPLLAPALGRSPDRPATCGDGESWLLARLAEHEAQLWAVYDGDRPVAAIVTTVQQSDRQRRCLLWLIGGHRARDWADLVLALIGRWARARGCTALWGSGRRGWARLVEPRGFRRIADVQGQPAWERRMA